jgi:parallel beta-helix repeat protein
MTIGLRGWGIRVGFLSKGTVINNTLTNNSGVGIYITDNTEVLVENNTITGMKSAPGSPYASGIEFNYKVKGVITNNKLDNNAVYYTIAVFDCPDEVKVTNNKISNGKPSADGFGSRGIQVQDSQLVTVSDNGIKDMGQIGIRFLRAQGQIANNTVLRATIVGILVTDSRGTIEKNGVISETQLAPDGTFGVGIQVENNSDFSITENNVTQNRRGIVVTGQNALARIDKNIIDRNNVRGSGTGAIGVLVMNRAQAEVTNNQITNNGTGIFTDQTGQVTKCTGNTFSGNQLNTQGNVRCG